MLPIDDLKVSYLKKSDLEELCVIENDSHPDPWGAVQFEQEIMLPNAHFLVVRDHISGRIIAYGGFWHILDEAHITKVTVARSFRKMGIGRHILEELLERSRSLGCRKVLLELRSGNEPAKRLYVSCGFKETGIRSKYYKSGDDALLMELII